MSQELPGDAARSAVGPEFEEERQPPARREHALHRPGVRATPSPGCRSSRSRPGRARRRRRARCGSRRSGRPHVGRAWASGVEHAVVAEVLPAERDARAPRAAPAADSCEHRAAQPDRHRALEVAPVHRGDLRDGLEGVDLAAGEHGEDRVPADVRAEIEDARGRVECALEEPRFVLLPGPRSIDGPTIESPSRISSSSGRPDGAHGARGDGHRARTVQARPAPH